MNATIRRLIHPETKVLDAAKGIVEYVASDETIDSYREVIRAKGWQFTRFAKNSPLVDSHDYSSIEKLVGQVIDFRVAGGKLVEVAQWAIDVPENKLAQIGWRMTAAGYLKAVSVGFQPVSYLHQDGSPEWQEQMKELGIGADAPQPRLVYTAQEQLELSVVIIGANPNATAIARAYKSGAIDDADLDHISMEYGKRETARATISPALVAWATERARERFLDRIQTAVKNIKS